MLVGVREVGAIERCEGVSVRDRFEEKKSWGVGLRWKEN